MALKLYDLAAADEDRRFSPFCWRIKMAVAHKGLEVETIPWRFTEKDVIAFSGQGRVPVLVDGDKTIADSWIIANYLEDVYSDRPSLFGGEGAREATRFVVSWADGVLQPALAPLVLIDIHAHLHNKDKDYFRSSREKFFGTSLEALSAERDATVGAFRQLLQPLRMTLRHKPFLGGVEPRYADYAVFGAFQWARAISPFRLLEPDDAIFAWRERLLDAHGKLARRSAGYDT